MTSPNLDALFTDIQQQVKGASQQLPPVEKWNPPLSGVMDMTILKDGQWIHEGAPIQRKALVKLFSSILKREGDQYFLVTPVEKWQITVEDVPFTVVTVEPIFRDGIGALVFKTSVDETVLAGPKHPIRVTTDPSTGEPSPYLLVRNNMEGRINRNVFYELANLAEEGIDPANKKAVQGVYSLGAFFPLA